MSGLRGVRQIVTVRYYVRILFGEFEMKALISACLAAVFLALSATTVLAGCECRCVDQSNPSAGISFQFPSVPDPSVYPEQCRQSCAQTTIHGAVPAGSCMLGSGSPNLYQVDWCGGGTPPANATHLAGTSWNPDNPPLLCLDAAYGKQYRTWCYVHEDAQPNQQCVGAGSSSCGTVGWVSRSIFPNDPYYSKCIKIQREDDKAKYFDLFYVETSPN